MIPQNPPSSTRACPTFSSRATSYSSQIPNPTSNCPMYPPGCRISPNGGLLPAASRAFYPISVPSILGFPHQCPFLFADTQEPPTSTWPPLSHSHLPCPSTLHLSLVPPHSTWGPWRPAPQAAGGEGTPAPTLSAISYSGRAQRAWRAGVYWAAELKG